MNLMVHKAYKLAKKAHKGQVDKAGRNYIEHPKRVAKKLKSPTAKIVGYLHDVVEDTSYTLDDIEKIFGKEIRDKVSLMTHRKEDSYDEYVKKIMTDPICCEVKLSDLVDNMNLFRLDSDKIDDHMIEKYKLYCKYYIMLIEHLYKK